MAPYSMDLRTRVLRDWDAGMAADTIAEKYHVSRAWVHRLQQRRRETGSIQPQRQTRWRTPVLAPHLAQLAALIQEQPGRTLAELQAALGTTACLATIWRTVKQLGFTLNTNGTRVRTGPPRRRRRAPRVADDHRHG